MNPRYLALKSAYGAVLYWEWPLFMVMGLSGLFPGRETRRMRPWDWNPNSRVPAAQRYYGWGFEDVPKLKRWV